MASTAEHVVMHIKLPVFLTHVANVDDNLR